MVWPFTSPKYEHSAAEVNALDREYDYIVVGGTFLVILLLFYDFLLQVS